MQIFYKFFKIFQKVFDEYIFAEYPSAEPKFWRRHCSTGLERKSCMKFCPMFPPPEPKPGTAFEHIYNLVDVIVSHVYKVNTEISMLVGR